MVSLSELQGSSVLFVSIVPDGGAICPQVPGFKRFATISPMKIAISMLVNSSHTSFRPDRPGISVVIKACSTASKISGVASARKASAPVRKELPGD